MGNLKLHEKKNSAWRSLAGHFRDIGLVTLIGVIFSMLFIPSEHLTWESFWYSMLYSLIIGATLWKGNEFASIGVQRVFKWKSKPTKSLFLSIISMLVVSVLIIIGVNYVWFSLYQGISFPAFASSTKGQTIMILQILITIIISLSFYVKEFLDYQRLSLQREESWKREKLQLEYEALKNQVNPHFLFNSLNTLSSLIKMQPKLAGEFVDKLADVYRYVLIQRSTELVSLEEEWQFMMDYLELQQIRLGDALLLDSRNIQLKGFKIIPLALQLLVENAIKHNTASQSDPLKLTISQDESYIQISHPLKPKQLVEKTEQPREKTGLANLTSRYRLLTDRPLIVDNDKVRFTVKIPLI